MRAAIAAGLVVVASACGASSSSPRHPGGGSPPSARPGNDVDDVDQLAVGDGTFAYAGCVVRGGTVSCWGGPNVVHEIGRRDGDAMPGPNEIAGVSGVRSIAMGGRRACALLADGAVSCWVPPAAPIDTGLRGAEQVACGTAHCCARLADGTVSCWGSNAGFAVGDTSAPQADDLPPTPVANVRDAIDVSAGTSFSCAVAGDGATWCWGAHPFAARASSEPQLRTVAAPVVVAGAPSARRVVAGYELACIVTTEGAPWCARREGAPAASPRRVGPAGALVDVVDAAAGAFDACFVLQTGAVYCWGPGPRETSVDGLQWDRRVGRAYGDATEVRGIDDAVQVAVTVTHHCVVTRDRTVRCWGDNGLGQIGDGTTTHADAARALIWYFPTRLPEPPGGVGGCVADVALREHCAQTGIECALEPPPAYWHPSPRGGADCDERCQRGIEAELARRAVPTCMCTCSDAYRDAYQRMLDEDHGPPPP